jgi:hypothetical protein
MNVEIGAEAALFPEKEYINGIAVAVRIQCVYGVLGLRQINTCRKGPLRVNFLDDDILHCLLWILSFYVGRLSVDLVERKMKYFWIENALSHKDYRISLESLLLKYSTAVLISKVRTFWSFALESSGNRKSPRAVPQVDEKKTHKLYTRGLQCFKLNGNHTEKDRYWQKYNFLLFAKCLKMYSFFRICSYCKVCKKCYYDPKKIFLEKYHYGYQKNA